MPNAPIKVYIVDDEPSVCTAYARLVRSAKMQPRTFASVEDFMAGKRDGDKPGTGSVSAGFRVVRIYPK